MPPATRDEIAALLGDIDDAFVTRIVDTGASVDEIGEALGDLEGSPLEPGHVPSSPAVAQVRTILDELSHGRAPEQVRA